ncbi:MAG: AMP-binding protein [Anaerolineales bacterium]|jgi:acyl-coenzyme A synthetase/AMP-(fatty) acid ligase/thioesterase domain-containing protein/acyl carrier protein
MDSSSVQAVQALSFNEDEIAGTIPDRFARVVSAFPDQIAVRSESRSLTYRELGQQTDQLAWALRVCLGDEPEAVALLIAPGLPTVSALLATVKAGKFYCSLNPDEPTSHSTAILANVRARLLITDQALQERARRIAPDGCRVVTLEELQADAPHKGLPSLPLGPRTQAAIYYTSGSTGKPKGIPRDHQGMLHRAWLDQHAIGVKPGDRLIMLRGFMFSGSSGDISSTLLTGACLVVYDVKKLGIASLAKLINSEAITIFRPPIELLRYFLDSLEDQDFFPSIRCLVLSGDVLFKRDIAQIRLHFPKEAVIVHHLAASETGVLARLVIGPETRIEGEIVPVGYPVPGKEILILDDDGRKLAPGMTGEISVRSSLIDSESGNYPDFMENQFVTDPDHPSGRIYRTGDLGRMRQDGLLEFVGRKDFQQKIRGYRVNTTAILSKLMEVNGVRRAAVTARADPTGEKRLVAYLIPARRAHLSAESLRASLAQDLPDYMLPAAFVLMDQIPVNANGKIDYRALPDPDWSHPEVQSKPLAPRDDIEWRLVDLWQAVLGVEQIGIQDDFFALGGHSLTAADLVVRIEKEFGKKLYPAMLLENNTVERLAQVLRQQNIPTKLIIPIQTGGGRPPLFLAPGNEGDTLYFRSLASYLGADQPVYGLQVTDLSGALPALTDLEAMAAYYGREIRALQPTGPYYLAGHSFGGRLAFAIAQLLAEAGDPIGLLVLMDTFAPGQHPQAKLHERILIHLDNLRTLPVRDWFGYFRQRANNAIVRLSRYRAVRFIIGRMQLVPPDPASKNRIAARGYVYRPYPGKLTFFRVKDRPSFVRADLTAGWREYAAALEVHDVPGDHATLIREPHLRVLAGELNKCLQEAQSEAAAKNQGSPAS